MFPILFEFGPVVIPAWHTLFLLGAVAAYFLLLHGARRLAPSVSEKDINGLYICAYLGGYFGARLLSIFIDELQIKGFADTVAALFRLGPMTFYGGAIGSLLCGGIYMLIKRLPFGELYDVSIPAALVGLALGRIGCFLNGDDYGKAVPFEGEPPWWAVVFPNLRDGVARYPVQIISAIFCLCLALLLLRNAKRIRNSFGTAAIGILGTAVYANYRFVIEFYRDDPRGTVLGDLFSTSQFISILVLLLLMAVTAVQWIRKSR